MTIQEFRSLNLTKRSRITLEDGKYLGDTVSNLAVYYLYDFWIILDEDFTKGNNPSYVNMKSATALEDKPYIHDSFDENDSIRLI